MLLVFNFRKQPNTALGIVLQQKGSTVSIHRLPSDTAGSDVVRYLRTHDILLRVNGYPVKSARGAAAAIRAAASVSVCVRRVASCASSADGRRVPLLGSA